MSDYITAAETAKLLRVALKAKFPKVKFSVRSETYAGGASIRVGWIDGPQAWEVDPIAQKFAGADFDGMIDLKTHHPIYIDGKAVRTLNDFVFCEREVTEPVYRSALEEVAAYYGGDFSDLVISTSESYRFKGAMVARGIDYTIQVPNARESLVTLAHRALSGALRSEDVAVRRTVA